MAKASINTKKSNNMALPCLRETVKPRSGTRVLDLGIQKLSTKILGCLPSPHST